MSLFNADAISTVRKLIIAAHNLNDLGDGGREMGSDEPYDVTLAQLGEVFNTLAEHYEDTNAYAFGSDEDVDMAMSIIYGKLYVYALSGELFAS